MRAVFDLDDTISIHVNRDYQNAKPILPVIEKMKQMKKDGWEIVIYSSRGQVSCKGNLEEIEKKNRPVVAEWLKRYDVPCDELIFGKPIADVYVDDKGMSVGDFLKYPFCFLHGGSGKKVYRIGNVVKKDLGDDVENYKNWIEDNHSYCKYPSVISYLYNEVTMKYIEGDLLCDSFHQDDLHQVLNIVERFKNCKMNSFEMEEQVDILNKNLSGSDFDNIVTLCAGKLKFLEKSFAENASFCHGDMTLCNIIKADDGLYFIDQRYRRNASSYLLDLGKLRMSLMNYEKNFGISDADNSEFLPLFDEIIKGMNIYEEVVTANMMYICRLYRYKQDKEPVIRMANDLLMEAQGVF